MFPCAISYQGITHPSSENAYQYEKAKDVKNVKIQNVILKSPDGLTAKKLSKDLDEGKCRTWNTENSIRVMHELLEEKYKQVPAFLDTLIKSGRAFHLEATGGKFLGVGLWCPVANTHPLSEIKGRNVLGWMLMALRDVKMV